jgi:hypothetical protein
MICVLAKYGRPMRYQLPNLAFKLLWAPICRSSGDVRGHFTVSQSHVRRFGKGAFEEERVKWMRKWLHHRVRIYGSTDRRSEGWS